MSKIEWTDETWKDVPKYEGYCISDLGRIKGPGKGRNGNKLMNPMKTEDGYLFVLVRRANVPRKLFVHRAVLSAFVGPCPCNCESMHFPDPNTENNKLANLKWGTRKEQRRDEISRGKRIGENCVASKLKEQDILKIRELKKKITARKLAEKYNVSHTTILKAANRQSWRHI
ncbi:hypothetical protein LCGC14_2815800 [marine sediment metagenome]|uniref:HNH nuclease domain-containing protein n=1 Tax=marine sediment metagenome TaxID=412755 RepID=A0A0F8YIH5_9ZZZZ